MRPALTGWNWPAAVPIAEPSQGHLNRCPFILYTLRVNQTETMILHPLAAAHALAAAIVTLTERQQPDDVTAVIRALHNTSDGAEWLRLIVRDDILGVANIVANALWVNL